jgi:hypothetical protein
VTYWKYREQLSRQNKLRRSVYEALRDELDAYLTEHALIDSYNRFIEAGLEYPFVEKRELKPRARIPDVEYEHHNRFLVFFVEDAVRNVHKKYIRYFDDNKTTKENLMRFGSVQFTKKYFRNIKFFESVHFSEFLKGLLPVDYALLIQRDASLKSRNRYALSHFRVRIDWPIADAAEDMARDLRYISKDLFERGERYAEEIQKKFFEASGLPATSGGRRTAAVVGAQLLKHTGCITTTYVASSESRALYRISERGISKYILLKLGKKEAATIAEANKIKLETLLRHYAVAEENEHPIVVFQASYERTSHGRPPEDGKLRDLNPEYSWITVVGQDIIPKPGEWARSPLPHSIIYT